MGIGTLGSTSRHDRAYGAIANGSKLMPRRMILNVTDSDSKVVWPVPGSKARRRGSSAPRRLHHDKHPRGNTSPQVNPFWGEWAIYDHSVRRPAAYKTGTTNEIATSATAMSRRRRIEGAGPRRRRLDGQQRQLAEHGYALAQSSAGGRASCAR
jgi:membrane peptidoglycan carboxypeptidase